MGSSNELEELRSSLKEAEHLRTELDRRAFHLKTLYDVSRDIYGSIETDDILRSFLFSSMGNFGAAAGFILLMDPAAIEGPHMISAGLEEDFDPFVTDEAREDLARGELGEGTGALTSAIDSLTPFRVEAECHGLLGLGPKLTGDPYTDHDRELLDTLANNLGIALKNARSFEKILRLNKELQDKNFHLQAAIRKVEILESVKANLSKFVPATVCSILEKSPTGEMPESREQDCSVLFIDIEGYTRMCEKLGSARVGEVVEKCFSVFMDAIYANHGDVNETAGDGLMVLFLDEDRTTNALQAVQAALRIRDESARFEELVGDLAEAPVVNMGINSGPAFVGAAKFNSYTGSRWTYTARGSTTNVAARLGALATGGRIFVSGSTAGRVQGHYSANALGKFKLKNVSEEVDVFEL